MRGLVPVSLLLMVAFSGCVEEPSSLAGDDDVDTDEEAPLPLHRWADPHPSGPINTTTALHWNGTLGTFAYGCEQQTVGRCEGIDVTPHDYGIQIDAEGLWLDSFEITLSWDAATQLTERLTLNVMVMGLCEGCNSTHFGGMEGESPVTMSLRDLVVPTPEQHVVHVYATNPALRVPQAPMALFASVDQPIRVDGTLTFGSTLR